MPPMRRISSGDSATGVPFTSSRPTEDFCPAPVALKQLIIAPAERFEVLVDFADGKPVVLETGPDEEMGVFGRLAPDASADYVAVMRFEPTATMPVVKDLPTRLIDPTPVNPVSAVRRRQLVLNSGLCASRPEAGRHADMASLIGINGKPFDMERIDIESEARND